MKTIAVIGATGTQGSSVVKTLLIDQDQQWYIRALTRTPSSAKAQSLFALAPDRIALFQADTSNVPSLVSAFKDCNAIFAATDYWAPFSNPDLRKKYPSGEELRKFAYDDEIRHGKNIADAAQRVLVDDGVLEGFVFSLLPSCAKYSGGKYNKIWHFESKDVIKTYVETQCKALAAKMSVLYVAFYVSNILKMHLMTPKKLADGTGRFVLQRLCARDAKHPFIITDQDTGVFVKELLKRAPGITLLGYTAMLSWGELGEVWARAVGRELLFQEMTLEEFKRLYPVEGEELLSATYSAEFGFVGGDETVLRPSDVGIVDMSDRVEEWMARQDWRAVLEGSG